MEEHEIPLADLDSNDGLNNRGDANENKIQIGKDGLPINVIQSENISNGASQSNKHSKNGFNSNDSIDSSSDQEIENNKSSANIDSENPADDSKIDEENPPLIIRTKRFATIMNLLNSQLGAGILSVPSTFVNTGISLLLLFYL